LKDQKFRHDTGMRHSNTFNTKNTPLKDCLLKAKVFFRNYSKENNKGLYIYGPTGTGKTHLSIGILKELIQRGFDGVFYNVVDLLDANKINV
jgi:DNA replication protein DnaC